MTETASDPDAVERDLQGYLFIGKGNLDSSTTRSWPWPPTRDPPAGQAQVPGHLLLNLDEFFMVRVAITATRSSRSPAGQTAGPRARPLGDRQARRPQHRAHGPRVPGRESASYFVGNIRIANMADLEMGLDFLREYFQQMFRC